MFARDFELQYDSGFMQKLEVFLYWYLKLDIVTFFYIVETKKLSPGSYSLTLTFDSFGSSIAWCKFSIFFLFVIVK